MQLVTTQTSVPRRTRGLSGTADGRVVPSVRRRLVPAIRGSDRFTGWAAAVAVTLLAGFLRLWRLGTPNDLLFDETYYAKDAWSLLQHGYTTGYVDDADKQIIDGKVTGIFTDDPSMVVHPEAGKWLIALGEWAFGMDSFGWRVASAVVGALMVLVLIRLVRRLTGSTLLGCTAGLLLCFDGLHFVMSRLALLDIFMAFFVLCAVSCLVADRDWGRWRLAMSTSGAGAASRVRDRPAASGWGPVRGMLFRPWRLAAGVLFGLAVATKWNAVFPLAAFGLLVWAWDAGARRALGVRRAWLRAALVDALPAFGYLVVVALLVYVATWTGWLLHAGEYERALSDTQYGSYWGAYVRTDAQGVVGELTQSLRSLWNYHQDVFTFHSRGLDDATHAYASNPTGWLLLNRPVGVDAQLDIAPGEQGCTAPEDSTCLRQVLLLGTPALWWGGVLALVYAVFGWLGRRDWRYGIAVIGVLASWLPWLRYDDRPIFSYYAVAMIPFTIIAIVLLLGTLIGDERASYRRRLAGTVVAGTFVVLVVANFAWFWPIYTDQLITTPDWLDRVWFERWI
ncbi:MAG: Protein-O-mannosyltransferase [uncultured Nocardioidaceae bacterium]|uniref:Polyprenol-phosphate-mannose--protein mannosyltransferase n=1 Tax=uncultured Nocardioidaceae bacterium TaxID=253824 RepID=A0A6J4LX69_9ACTN|nr:MAG: Protein-O-mannosyltransferase [uncultured Nocardioidaceae bacterium]